MEYLDLLFAGLYLSMAIVIGTLFGILSHVKKDPDNNVKRLNKDVARLDIQVSDVGGFLVREVGLLHDHLSEIENHIHENDREMSRRSQATKVRTQEILAQVEDIQRRVIGIEDTIEMKLINPNETYELGGVEHDNKVVTRDEDPNSIFIRGKKG